MPPNQSGVRATEVALRRHLEDTRSEHPTYAGITPAFAEKIRAMPQARTMVLDLGPVRSITFSRSVRNGAADLYDVITANGHTEWMVGLSPDGKIATLVFKPVQTPPAVPLTPEQFAAEVRDRLKSEAAANRFSGTVLVAKAGKPIFEAAYGSADRQHGIPNQMDTKFRVGSMNKMFTAMAVLQLYQAGKLGLDDVVGKYLTKYPNTDVATKVTIRHLLNHTGGTGNIFGPEWDQHYKQIRKMEDYVDLFGKRGLAYQPGSRWEYSNYGYVLLGLIVAKASGQDYFDYVREKIFRPAGMTGTDSEPEDVPVPGRSIGYTDGAKGQVPNTDMLPARACSAGGGYSTAGDMLRFANALQAHRLLSETNTALLTTGTVKARDGKYAMGFLETMPGGVRQFGHGGSGPGQSGDLTIFPASGYVIVVLANLDPPVAELTTEFIAARLPK